MATLQLNAAPRTLTTEMDTLTPSTLNNTNLNNTNPENANPTEVSADAVRNMLHEIAFVLHTTRVIGRRDSILKAHKG